MLELGILYRGTVERNRNIRLECWTGMKEQNQNIGMGARTRNLIQRNSGMKQMSEWGARMRNVVQRNSGMEQELECWN